MIAHVDIENAHTGKVITYDLPVLDHIEDKYIKIDISSLTNQELEILELAISSKKELEYTDVEMFFIDDETVPNFGPDYDFFIKDNQLVGYCNRDLHPRRVVK